MINRNPLLRLVDVSATYGGPDVLQEANIEIGSGEIVAILGPNGAGKTTLLNAISGLIRVTAGSITFNGESIRGRTPDRIVGLGVAHIPQGRRLFPYLTGYQNLKLGAYTRRDRHVVEQDIRTFVERWPVVERVLHRQGQLMSGGEQQVVAIGRALMSRPRLLLLDEPSMGLAPVLVDNLFSMLTSIVRDEVAERGMAVALVEQNVQKALAIADRVYILLSGRVIHSSPAKGLTAEAVGALYLGGPRS